MCKDEQQEATDEVESLKSTVEELQGRIAKLEEFVKEATGGDKSAPALVCSSLTLQDSDAHKLLEIVPVKPRSASIRIWGYRDDPDPDSDTLIGREIASFGHYDPQDGEAYGKDTDVAGMVIRHGGKEVVRLGSAWVAAENPYDAFTTRLRCHNGYLLEFRGRWPEEVITLTNPATNRRLLTIGGPQ